MGTVLVPAEEKPEDDGSWMHGNEAFERMSEAELEAYAREGELPNWFPKPEGGG